MAKRKSKWLAVPNNAVRMRYKCDSEGCNHKATVSADYGDTPFCTDCDVPMSFVTVEVNERRTPLLNFFIELEKSSWRRRSNHERDDNS